MKQTKKKENNGVLVFFSLKKELSCAMHGNNYLQY